MSGIEFDARETGSILEHFADLDDPRSEINRRHLLGDLIVICVLAVIAGADGPTAIGEWAKSNGAWLKQYLPLPSGIPSRCTFRRLLSLLKPEAFQQCFQSWVAQLQSTKLLDEPEIIAIDGKALRRSHDGGKNLGPLYLVSAWAAHAGISLGQLATAEKSNEITAIPRLLQVVDVHGAIVTIDAAGCQRNIAELILQGKGDYVLALKGNQESLHQDVVQYLITHMENDFANITARRHQEVAKGHGRVDEIIYYQVPVPPQIIQKHAWPGLRSIGVAIRMSEQADKHSYDVRYYISSLRLGVKQFARAVRKHWSIENTLHWCLDVTFREDESRTRNRHEADNLAWLKRFAVSLLKQQNDKRSIAMRRRVAGWNTDYLAQVVGLTVT